MSKQRGKKFNYILASKWLFPHLLNGVGIRHEDAIAAGYGHRLASIIYHLREHGFRGLIFTDFGSRKYYISPKLRRKARALAEKLDYITIMEKVV